MPCDDVCITIVEAREIGGNVGVNRSHAIIPTGVNIQHLYMRGCVERMFLFNLDPRLRQIFAQDAQVGAAPVTTSGAYNRRSINVRAQGTGLKQALRYHSQSPTPGGSCRRVNRMLLLASDFHVCLYVCAAILHYKMPRRHDTNGKQQSTTQCWCAHAMAISLFLTWKDCAYCLFHRCNGAAIALSNDSMRALNAGALVSLILNVVYFLLR